MLSRECVWVLGGVREAFATTFYREHEDVCRKNVNKAKLRSVAQTYAVVGDDNEWCSNTMACVCCMRRWRGIDINKWNNQSVGKL